MADKTSIFSGARASLYINQTEIGYATGCSGSEDIDVVPITVLNNVQVKEFVPVGYSVSFSASKVYLIGDSFKKNNVFPKTDVNPQTHLENLLTSGGTVDGLTISIFDSRSNTVFMALQQAQMVGRSWSFGPRDIVGTDISFVGVRMFDAVDLP